jgi:1-acyl-sn-glycerol-3-phosphate acyltransferase
LAVELGLLAASPLLVAITALVSAARRDSRALRVCLLVLVWAAGEPYAIVRIVRLRQRQAPDEEWAAFLRWFVNALYASVRLLLGVGLALDPASVQATDLAGAGPLVVLARHSGPGDPFLIAWLLVEHYRLRIRVVAKAALRLEPAVDLAGEQLGVCFVRAGRRGSSLAAIRLQAEQLAAGDALLIFPEGANFSVPRRSAALAELRRSGRALQARRAGRMRRLLPPRSAGTTAALAAAPAASVLLVAHSGFGASGRPWWRLPINETVRVRSWLVAAEDVPRAEREVERWLLDRWAEVDRWLAVDAGAHPHG